MKAVHIEQIQNLPGRRLNDGETFRFRCAPGIGCFNRCCRNLNLFLYPYDVIRLKKRLNLSSDQFLDQYVEAVLRTGGHFPDVVLRMADNAEQTCPFLTDEGCGVYPDRPLSCRVFPVEQGLLSGPAEPARFINFFRPPDFCLGSRESQEWGVEEWLQDQGADPYIKQTIHWAQLKSRFQESPWGTEGPHGAKAKMSFMAVYNVDRFRDFVFGSSFLKRYRILPKLQKRLRADDVELLNLGMEWVGFFLWGIRPARFQVR